MLMHRYKGNIKMYVSSNRITYQVQIETFYIQKSLSIFDFQKCWLLNFSPFKKVTKNMIDKIGNLFRAHFQSL